MRSLKRQRREHRFIQDPPLCHHCGEKTMTPSEVINGIDFKTRSAYVERKGKGKLIINLCKNCSEDKENINLDTLKEEFSKFSPQFDGTYLRITART